MPSERKESSSACLPNPHTPCSSIVGVKWASQDAIGILFSHQTYAHKSQANNGKYIWTNEKMERISKCLYYREM